MFFNGTVIKNPIDNLKALNTALEFLILGITAFVSFFVFIAVSILFGVQLSIVLSNKTNIEKLEENSVRAACKPKYPFDLGWKKNIFSVMGESVMEWIFTGSPKGDGYSFETNNGDSNWPPHLEDDFSDCESEECDLKSKAKKYNVDALIDEDGELCIRIPNYKID
ncbi:hypothetical protein O9G_003960 [Rozella allomycis CSF55]|uniref:Uncharacterized protein n=1 Tax=Rozella allomycis (strain CSF55) TaxID=988480 RepID=A0A075AZ39_ROZAC|nr:hypothetical protein O9G_003960 [Rozella allomycis CSF55]|eukprot:EPZ35527.1 hypothetical protein O9G_003960 [Rozella allomycis CSF55]